MNYSYSALSTYILCSLKYYFQYVLRISFTEKSVPIFLGNCVHSVLEHYYRSDKKLTENELIDYFTEIFEFGFLTDDIITYFPKQREYSYDMGIRAIKQFCSNEISNIRPAVFIGDNDKTSEAIELYFKLPVMDLKTKEPILENVNVTGLIDIVEESNGKVKIKDHKTTSKEYTDFFIDTSLQLAMYSYAVRFFLAHNKIKNVVATKEESVGYNIFVKPKAKSELKIIERKITKSDLDTLFQTIINVDKGVKNEIFIPAFNDACEAFGGCQFKDICYLYTKNKKPFKDRKLINPEYILKMYPGKVEIRNGQKK